MRSPGVFPPLFRNMLPLIYPFAVQLQTIFLLVLVFASCSRASELPDRITLRHLAMFPHQSNAFTQGLLWNDGFLYESTGQYGSSSLRQVEPKTGYVTKQFDLPKPIFAEGLALVDDSLFQISWREKICFVYEKSSFQVKKQFRYPGEGWGITFDGTDLLLSDGTNVLRFYDPNTFRLKRKIEVKDVIQKKRPEPVRNLNELEWVCGEVWSNVWQTTRIVRINPQNGNVIGWIEMSPFVPKEHQKDTQNCVLNGIAFDPATRQVYITGKYWNVMHQFQLEIPTKGKSSE